MTGFSSCPDPTVSRSPAASAAARAAASLRASATADAERRTSELDAGELANLKEALGFGAKGARLTAHVSIPGRYVVYSPSGQLSGISRKLPEGERNRLKGILEELVGDAASVIIENTVPEPESFALLGLGALGLAAIRRRK